MSTLLMNLCLFCTALLQDEPLRCVIRDRSTADRFFMCRHTLSSADFSSALDDSSAAYALPLASFAYSVIGLPPNDLNSWYTAPQTGPYFQGWNDSVRSLRLVARWYRNVTKNMSFWSFIGVTSMSFRMVVQCGLDRVLAVCLQGFPHVF